MKNILPIVFYISIIAAVQAQGNRYYVHAQAQGANTGLSWADAFTDLQSALQLAQAGDEVWVAEGTYKPTAGANRAISFEPASGMRLFGGFAGTENNPNERDLAAHPAVLSGDIGLPGDSTDNAYNVVYLHQPDSNTVLDGFIVRDGVADAPSTGAYARGRSGAGLYIMGEDWEAYPDIRNCTFAHNTARNFGGGVMVNGRGAGSVAPQFIGCRFEDNRAMGSGGGLAWIGAAWVERKKDVYATVFYSNYAGIWGGGMYFADSDRLDRLDISKSEFTGNQSYNPGGGAYLSIGRANGAEISIFDTDFNQNSARDGAALYISPASFLFTKVISIDNCKFKENTISQSGASQAIINISPLFSIQSIGYILNSLIKNNVARHIMLYDSGEGSRINMENLYYSSNQLESSLLAISYLSKMHSKNIFFIGNKVNRGFLDATQIKSQKFVNCIFYNNYSQINSRYFGPVEVDSNLLQNCIFWRNSINQLSLSGSPDNLFLYNTTISDIPDKEKFLRSNNKTYIAHSAFDTLSCAALPANVTCGPGLLVGIDPMFVNPDSGDFRLQPCSPLIDAGSNAYLSPADSTDLAGRPRVRGASVDIGAYEAQGPSLAAAPQATPSCPGGASGALDIAVQDACPPLAFHWQSGVASGTGTAGLPTGAYLFTVTDARGQSAGFTATVPEGAAPALSGAAIPVVCGDTLGGSASATLAGATPPYTWAWAGSNSTDSLRTGLAAGAYPVTVSDANGCTAEGTVQVDKSGNLSIDIELQAISCSGAADGSFTVLPVDGKAPYLWHWEDGTASPTLGPLGPGTYLGTLTDALGCAIGWILPLDEPEALHANPQVTPASDSSSADGSVALTPSGGTGPFDALWSNGASGLFVDSLAVGLYTVTLTDAHDCTAVETVPVGVTSGTGEADARSGFRLYPNPARDAVWLVVGQSSGQEMPVRVTNAAGVLIWERLLPAGTERVLLNTFGWPGGVYTVQVYDAARKLVLR